MISGDMALTVYQSGVGQGEACVTAAMRLHINNKNLIVGSASWSALVFAY